MSDDLKSAEWWWIDFLENEMDPGLERDLELLLQHSEEDRDTFEQFRMLREWARCADPVRDWPIDERLTRLRCRVMREIERENHFDEPATKSLSV